MGDDSAEKNQRRHADGNVLFGLNRSQHQVGARVLSKSRAVIGKHDQQTSKGQKKNKPVVGLAGGGNPIDTDEKGGACQTADYAGDCAENQPT